MKIAVINASVFAVPVKGYSGLEHLAWQHAKGLAEKGHQVALISPQGSTCPGVSIIPTGPPGQWDEAQAYSTYWQHLPSFDVIIDHSWQKHSYVLKMEGRLRAPILGVCHAPVNTMFSKLPNVPHPCFVCISQDQANHFQALFNKKAEVAYNGIDLGFYKPIGLPRSKRFLFLARFSTIKGPDLAIAACQQTGQELDLVGDTSITGEPDFLKACQERCDGKHIRMVGPASRGECVWYFSQAYCLLHPNERFREPFGLAPVEAMACGTPVICWRNGAMPETVKHGETGWIVESYDQLVETVNAVAHGGISDEMRKNCVEWASNFSYQKMVDRYEHLCHLALNRPW